MSPPPFRTRTDVLFASGAPVAVVLRRGPRTHWQLLLWDTRRDVFTPGQWMKGLVRLMDLSPSGAKLIYWAAQYHSSARWMRPREARGSELGPFDPLSASKHVLRRMQARHPKRKLPRYLTGREPGRAPAREVLGTWTAVSTPPYFSALAIWPAIGHWTGGGFFASENQIVLYEPDCGLTPIENVRIPITFRVMGSSALRTMARPPTLAHNPVQSPSEQQLEIELALKDAGARFVDWSHVTAGGDILFASDGSIYRHSGMPAVIGPGVLHNARRLIDLTPSRFELIRAPNAAMRW